MQKYEFELRSSLRSLDLEAGVWTWKHESGFEKPILDLDN
jgi:hypothetical protein